MKSKSLWDYFFFRTCVRYLQDIPFGARLHDSKTGWQIPSNLREFFNYLDDLDLQVTSRTTACANLREIYQDLNASDETALLTNDQKNEIISQMEEIRNTLEAEIKGFFVYVVTPKRIDVRKLLGDIPFLFAPGVYQRLPSIAQYDLGEAGKCIVYETSTAAAFHLMRATEAVLRAFCQHHLKTNPPLLWGEIVNKLRTSPNLSSNEYVILLNNLDNIRLSFRNPTQHPDKVYDIQEV